MEPLKSDRDFSFSIISRMLSFFAVLSVPSSDLLSSSASGSSG